MHITRRIGFRLAIQPCKLGKVAPDFEALAVFDEEFGKIRLSDYRDKKYAVLFFYPLNFTFVCTTEISSF